MQNNEFCTYMYEQEINNVIRHIYFKKGMQIIEEHILSYNVNTI